jgi:transcriptional regulator with XRE-family HTH domain
MTPRESLIAARKEAGLSRPALAKVLGICRSHVHHCEIGVRNPSPALMRRWAIALKPSSPIWTDADIERMSLQLKPVATKTRRAA